MKIIVSGANGYIGSHVVKALLDAGASCTAVDFSNAYIDPRAKFLPLNVLESGADIYVKLGGPDVFLHLAWKDGFAHNSPAHMEMLSAHARLVHHLLEGGLKHLAVMGTMHEVGYYEGAIDDNTPCTPISQYGIAKNALRESSRLLAHQHGATWQWLRAFYIYGDDANAHSIFGKLLQAAREGKTAFPFTSGKNKYDFIPVTELARQIAACIMQDKITGIVNCCSGRPVSLGEQVEEFIRENNLNIRLEYGAYPDRAYDSPAVWGDSTKIQRIMAQK
ncbi:NAD-dependent epimerase/dehydratase family protein [Candidatus Avelusimicrobium alvi]|uniref:NAD-dependent epimerase/dehydratase family protein n=1 Tax=Candidatus Avelusimicrobium alvi TaxID=3416221 RepID=UPI003D0A5380